MKAGNIFIEKTLEGLEGIGAEHPLIAPQGFKVEDNKEGKCILIIGLNPAGDEDDATREKNNQRTYFYSLEHAKSKSGGKWFYNKYFSPINKFVNATVDNNAKWPWANKDITILMKETDLYDDLHNYKNTIEEDYKIQKNREYTIYIGDMFYYHETKSKELPFKIIKTKERDDFYKNYCETMLELHIKELDKFNKSIEYVYINNSQVSRWMSGVSNETYITYEFDGVQRDENKRIPVFFGAMLSAGNMDVFSRERLIKEIKSVIY